MSVGCIKIEAEASTLVQPTDITCKQYTKCRLWSAFWGWAINSRNVQRPLLLNKLNKKCTTLFSVNWYTNLWCTVNKTLSMSKPRNFPAERSVQSRRVRRFKIPMFEPVPSHWRCSARHPEIVWLSCTVCNPPLSSAEIFESVEILIPLLLYLFITLCLV
jgi:hypothetical protein